LQASNFVYRAAPETVRRATYAFAAPIENMVIDHRGFDIVVAQEFLYGSDIIPVLQQMCRNPLLDSQLCQESIDLWFSHLRWVANFMEVYESLDPLTIRLLSPTAIVA
jgi:hypothetical protein